MSWKQMNIIGEDSDVDSITVLNISDDTKVSAMLSGDLDIACAPATTTLSMLEGNDSIDIVQVTGTRESDIEMNCREDILPQI